MNIEELNEQAKRLLQERPLSASDQLECHNRVHDCFASLS